MVKKTKTKANIGQTIRIKNSYFEQLLGPITPDGVQQLSRNFQALMDKIVFPGEYKPRYWLGRAFDKILQEMKTYTQIRQDLIREHTKKHDKDGKELKDGKVIKEWKKGDPISLPDGTPDWVDYELFLKEINELQEIEINLGIWKIEFDPEKGPDATPGEMQLLIPLLKEPPL